MQSELQSQFIFSKAPCHYLDSLSLSIDDRTLLDLDQYAKIAVSLKKETWKLHRCISPSCIQHSLVILSSCFRETINKSSKVYNLNRFSDLYVSVTVVVGLMLGWQNIDKLLQCLKSFFLILHCSLRHQHFLDLGNRWEVSNKMRQEVKTKDSEKVGTRNCLRMVSQTLWKCNNSSIFQL